jgi:hypothetical protein
MRLAQRAFSAAIRPPIIMQVPNISTHAVVKQAVAMGESGGCTLIIWFGLLSRDFKHRVVAGPRDPLYQRTRSAPNQADCPVQLNVLLGKLS